MICNGNNQANHTRYPNQYPKGSPKPVPVPGETVKISLSFQHRYPPLPSLPLGFYLPLYVFGGYTGTSGTTVAAQRFQCTSRPFRYRLQRLQRRRSIAIPWRGMASPCVYLRQAFHAPSAGLKACCIAPAVHAGVGGLSESEPPHEARRCGVGKIARALCQP